MTKKTTNFTDFKEDPTKLSGEELDQLDPDNQTDLETLGRIAKENTRSILALQRRRLELSSKGHSTEEVDRKLEDRVFKSGKLIRRRHYLQNQRNVQREKTLRDDLDLETVHTKIKHEKQIIINNLQSLLESVRLAKLKANHHGQRHLAAKLKAYEDSAINSLHLMNRLVNLEQVELEVD
jgi:hypothetical protein